MLLGQKGNTLTSLLIFIAVVFALVSFVKVIYLLTGSTTTLFTQQVLDYISLPASAKVFVEQPWSLLTYVVTHISIWHLISSLLWLWTFGYILHDLTGTTKLIPIFLYGGLAGGIFFLIAGTLIPFEQQNISAYPPLLGAGPACMAVAVATTALSPQYKLFPFINGGIPLWILTTVFILIQLATVGAANPSVATALLAGGLTGYIFTWQLDRGNDLSQWMVNVANWIDDLFNPEKKHIQKHQKNQLFYKATSKPFEKTPHVTQKRVDDLLDKINQHGYQSLTEEEKAFLKKASLEEL